MITCGNPRNRARDAQPKSPEPSRSFKGVWIRKSLWTRRDITWFQKCILAEIDSLTDDAKPCFASNAYLANLMGSTPGTIANELTKLRKKGLILDWGGKDEMRQLTIARCVQSDPPVEGGSPDGEGGIHQAVNKDTSGENRGLKKSKESPNGFGAADPSKIPAVWKPDPRSKEQKLAQTLPPSESDFPSEREFDAFVESNELDGITNYRPDLYGQLCDAKWRKWNDRAKKWVPIRDWRAYVKGLNDHIQDNF